MASTSAVSKALPLAHATQNKVPASEALFKPLSVRPSGIVATTRSNGRLEVKAASSLEEKAVKGLTTAAITTSLVIPEGAQAADGVTPSLKNFWHSVVAGAIIGVANFDRHVDLNHITLGC